MELSNSLVNFLAIYSLRKLSQYGNNNQESKFAFRSFHWAWGDGSVSLISSIYTQQSLTVVVCISVPRGEDRHIDQPAQPAHQSSGHREALSWEDVVEGQWAGSLGKSSCQHAWWPEFGLQDDVIEEENRLLSCPLSDAQMPGAHKC